MAIMNKMRKNMHIILFILLVFFLLSMTIGGLVGGADITALLSGQRPDTVVSINGEDIRYEQYTNIRQQQIDEYRNRNQREPSGYELQQLEDQIYESVIRDVLIKQFVDKQGVSVSRKEIAYHIFENPPDFLRSNESFADSAGNFDIEKYHAALQDERNLNYWKNVEYFLATSLPFQKIQDEILATVFVTDDEVREDFIKRNQKIKVKYLFFNPNFVTIDDAEISQKEIEQYYKEHKDEFQEEEKRRLQYVLYDLEPTSRDSLEILQFAESILDSINRGSDFSSLAEEYSEDPGSAAKGGDLGFFERGMMVKPFEDAAFSAQIGEVVGPVLSQHGYHIIKVFDRKQEDGIEKVKASHILFKIEPSRNTVETVRSNANYFAEMAEEDGFTPTALSEKVKVDTTILFSHSGFVPGLGMQQRMSDAIFNAKIGKPSRVNYIENQGYVIYEIIDIQKERIKPLSEVESQIKNAVRREKQMQEVAVDCRNFREKIQTPEDFERLAQQDTLTIQETDFFAMDGYIRNVGKDANFIGTAFGLEQNQVSAPVRTERGYYIIKLVEKQPFNEALFDLQKANLKIDLLETKKRLAYNDWFNQLKENAKIKDFRYKFYN